LEIFDLIDKLDRCPLSDRTSEFGRGGETSLLKQLGAVGFGDVAEDTALPLDQFVADLGAACEIVRAANPPLPGRSTSRMAHRRETMKRSRLLWRESSGGALDAADNPLWRCLPLAGAN
jgi:hypothetical protein